MLPTGPAGCDAGAAVTLNCTAGGAFIGGGAVAGFGSGTTGFASAVFGGASNGGRIGAGARIGAGGRIDAGAVTMDFGLTVGGAGAVGTDGGARRAVGFGGAIGVGAAGRRTATFGAGRDGVTGLSTGEGERLIGGGGVATLTGAGGAICRVAVPLEILPAGKFNFERGIVRGGGAKSPPRAPPAAGAGRRAMTGLVGIGAVFR